MWKRVIVLSFLAQQNISIEARKYESLDAFRQLRKNGDCCPCPVNGGDDFRDQQTAISRMFTTSADDDNCPCRSTSDSETASSLMRPLFRTVTPSKSPTFKKQDEANPLLRPEVGLASSVLETIKEVTDQEYQDALARDAARTALKYIEREKSNTEPRNVVNIILSPQEKNIGDVIPEASQIQTTMYIQPPLDISNYFTQSKLAHPVEFLKRIINTTPKLGNNGFLQRETVDMDGSPSDVKENIFQPLRSKILEDVKAKSSLLKSRLFSNTGNNIKNLQNNNLRSNLDNTPNQYAAKVLEKDLTKKSTIEEIKDADENYIDNKNDCVVESKILVPLKENYEDLDSIRAASNLTEVKVLNTAFDSSNFVQTKIKPDKYSNAVNGLKNHSTNVDSDATTTVTADNILLNHAETSTQVILEDNKLTDVDDGFKNISCLLNDNNDLQSEPSIANVMFSNLPQVSNSTNFLEDISKTEDVHTNNTKHGDLLRSTSAELVHGNGVFHSLPNIKADILRTLENFKSANEQIQEKLRINVKDALQFVLTTTFRPSLNSFSEKLQGPENNIISTKIEKSLTSEDMQKMADSNTRSDLVENIQNIPVGYENNDTDTNYLPKTDIQKYTAKSEDDRIDLNNDVELSENYSKADDVVCGINLDGKNSTKNFINHGEMIGESSNSVFNGIIKPNHLLRNYNNDEDSIFQPEDTVTPQGIINFLDNFKHTLQLNNDKKLYNLFSSDNNHNSDSLFKPLLENYDNENIYSDITPFNPLSSLNLFKAKVPSPSALNMNPLMASRISSKETDVLGYASHGRPTLSILRNPSGFYDSETLVRNSAKNLVFPHLDRHESKIPQTITWTGPKLTETQRSRTNDAYFKERFNNKDSFDMQPIMYNKNNILDKSLVNPDNLLGTVIKTRENFHDKLEAFRSDLSKRLNAMSSRKIPESSRLSLSPNVGTSENGAEVRNRAVKNIILPNQMNIQRSGQYNTAKNDRSKTPQPPKDITIIRPNRKQIIDSSPVSAKVGLKKGLPKISQSKNISPVKKAKLKSNLNLRPLKQNKVTISFSSSSTRPDILKQGPKLKFPTDKRSKDPLVKLPKLSQTLADKKLDTKSKLETVEPNILASEILLSKAPAPSKFTGKHFQGKSLDSDSNNNDEDSQDVSQPKMGDTPLLLKLKQAVSKRRKNEELSVTKITENTVADTQSASSNFPSYPNSSEGEVLKENLSYKCKMVCVKDILDATNLKHNT